MKSKRKILFIYPNQTGQVSEQLGVCYLSAILKKAGHSVELFNTTYLLYFSLEKIKMQLYKKINLFNPDLICFSCRSLEFPFARRIAVLIKEKYNIKIIFGGIHPTINPDEVLKCRAIDYVCIGEGEDSLLKLVENLNKNIKINNIWTRETKTPLNPLIQDLDRLPFPDRELFKIPSEAHNLIMTSRGCTYSCTYCFNNTLRKKYPHQRYVRFRDINKVIEEVKQLVEKYKLNHIFFCDDVFTSHKKRLIEFCEKYRELRVPFVCNARAEQIDEEIALALKKAGCIEIKIGIETGNEGLRKKVLHRFASNESIKRAFEICRKVGIKTYSFNMIGLPFETRRTIYETFNINKQVKPDSFQVSILYPFKGSEIYDIYKKNGYSLEGEKIQSFMENSIVNFPNLSKNELLAYHRFAPLYIKIPQKFYFLLSLMKFLPLKLTNIFKHKSMAKLYSLLRKKDVGFSQADLFKKTS